MKRMRPPLKQVFIDTPAPLMSVGPVLFLMDAFKVSADVAIDHLRTSPQDRRPIFTSTAEVLETKMPDIKRAKARHIRSTSYMLDISFMKMTVRDVVNDTAEPR